MELYLVLIVLFGIIGVILATISIIALIVSKLMHKDSVAKVSECVLWWSLFPFVLPFRARKLGIIRKSIYIWLLTLLSPFVAIIMFIVTIHIKMNLPDITHKEVVAITEIADFPEFEYRHYYSIPLGMTLYEGYCFKNEEDVERFFEKIDSLIADGENTFWSKDTLRHIENIEYYGSEIVYTYNRSWDSMYIEETKEVKVPRIARITIGKDVFDFAERHCSKWDIDYYSNVNILSLLTGVEFPQYTIVNIDCNDYDFMRHTWCATLKLDEKLSDELVQTIQKDEKWEKLNNGTYIFCVEDRDGQDLWECVTIDPNSDIAKLNVGRCYHPSWGW